ncbi:MAG: hypothetical protein ACRYFS_08655 [Janthinobacterium lividum]
MKPTETMPEAVGRVLTHLERQAGRTNSDAAYDGLLALPELPIDALGELGPLTRLNGSGTSDSVPSLLLETGGGQVQIEFCPFGPLALLSSDGAADTDPIAEALYAAGLYPLFPADIDTALPWHDAPLASWLFPRRLTQAFQLFETLRG